MDLGDWSEPELHAGHRSKRSRCRFDTSLARFRFARRGGAAAQIALLRYQAGGCLSGERKPFVRGARADAHCARALFLSIAAEECVEALDLLHRIAPESFFDCRTANGSSFLNAKRFGTILVGRIGRMLSLRTVQEVLASVCSTPTDFHRRGDVSVVRASV